MADTISYDDFLKLDLKTAKILQADLVEKSNKLVRLEIDIGEETRQIVAGIGKKYTPENLVGQTIVVITNLEPRKLMGIESRGMLLAANSDEGPILLSLKQDTPAGIRIQ